MTHYDVLGVGQGASDNDIRNSYKKLAKKYHPDKNPGNPEAEKRFKEISAAYSILSDQQNRAKYDQQLRAPRGPNINFDPFGGMGGFENLFAQHAIFKENLDVAVTVSIPFLDAKSTQKRTIKYARKVLCKDCRGTGAKSFHPKNCFVCKGQGQTVKTVLGGMYQATQICGACKGKGRTIKETCKCNDGFVKETNQIEVSIPAGISTGKILRVTGEGNQSLTGKGNLCIVVATNPPLMEHPSWIREGANVREKVSVSYPTLVLGGIINVETIWGREKVNVPPKTKAGQIMMLPSKGFPRLGRLHDEERGVHYIEIDLLLPDLNSKEHLELLQQLGQLYETP